MSDPFWNDAARYLLTNCRAYVATQPKPDRPALLAAMMTDESHVDWRHVDMPEDWRKPRFWSSVHATAATIAYA